MLVWLEDVGKVIARDVSEGHAWQLSGLPERHKGTLQCKRQRGSKDKAAGFEACREEHH